MNETRKDLEAGDFEFQTIQIPVTLYVAAQNVCQAMFGSEDQRLKIEVLREEGNKYLKMFSGAETND